MGRLRHVSGRACRAAARTTAPARARAHPGPDSEARAAVPGLIATPRAPAKRRHGRTGRLSQVPRAPLDESSPGREMTPRTLLRTARAGACGDARGRLSSSSPGARPQPRRPAPLTSPAPAARSSGPSLAAHSPTRRAAAIAQPGRALPGSGGFCFRGAVRPRPRPTWFERRSASSSARTEP